MHRRPFGPAGCMPLSRSHVMHRSERMAPETGNVRCPGLSPHRGVQEPSPFGPTHGPGLRRAGARIHHASRQATGLETPDPKRSGPPSSDRRPGLGILGTARGDGRPTRPLPARGRPWTACIYRPMPPPALRHPPRHLLPARIRQTAVSGRFAEVGQYCPTSLDRSPATLHPGFVHVVAW